MNRQLALMIAGGLTVAISGGSSLWLLGTNNNAALVNSQVAKPTAMAVNVSPTRIAAMPAPAPTEVAITTIQATPAAPAATSVPVISQNMIDVSKLNAEIQAANRILDERETLYQAKLKEAYAIIQQRESAYQSKLQDAYEKLQNANIQVAQTLPAQAAIPVILIEQPAPVQSPPQVAQVNPVQYIAQAAPVVPVQPIVQVAQPARQPEQSGRQVQKTEKHDDKKGDDKENKKHDEKKAKHKNEGKKDKKD